MRISSMVGGLGLALLASGCVHREVVVYHDSAAPVSEQVVESQEPAGMFYVVKQRPPPLRREVIISSPGPGHVWTAGYWQWNGQWVWIGGKWMAQPHPRAKWVNGRWRHRHGEYVWVKGYWR